MIELILLFILLLVVVSIVYTSIKIGISPMPSSLKARKTMLEAVKNQKCSQIIDVGSGFGFLALHFASRYPNIQVVGYEVSFFPWLISVIFKFFSRYENVNFYRKDFLTVDFPKDSVLVCYLYPKGMDALQEKLNKEELHITLIVSNTFAFSKIKPKKTLYLKDIYKTPIYIY